MSELLVPIIAFAVSGLGVAWAIWVVVRNRSRQRRVSGSRPEAKRASYTMTEESEAPSTTVPAPHATVASVVAASVESPRVSPVSVGHDSVHQWPDWFPASSRRVASETNRLPLVEAGQTPVADGSDYVFGPITPVLAAFLPDSEARKSEVRKELMQAGYYQPHAQQNLSAVRYVLIIGSLLVFGSLLLVAPPRLEAYALGATILFPILGWAFPRLVVKSKAADRTSAIERGMPDMLDMLYMCVSQGMTMPKALKRTKQELVSVYPELHQELDIVSEQAEIGNLPVALQNFADRIDVPEVHSFTTLMVQTEQMGTSVSQALVEYSDGMRSSLRQRSDEKANKASFKLLFPTVLCLMPAVYIFLLGPSIVKLHKFFSGPDSATTIQAREIIQRTGQQPTRGR